MVVDRRGFTLIELIISITLVSFVVLLLSMAMRSGLRAYERAKDLGGQALLVSSVLNLMDRQFAMVVSGKNPFTGPFMRFEGKERSILFTTTGGPMGTGGGGVLLVSYRYNEDEDALSYCQKIVTRAIDLRGSAPEEVTQERIEELRGEGWDCTLVNGIGDVEFRFSKREDDTDIEGWSDAWREPKRLPFAVAVKIKGHWTPFVFKWAVD